MFFDDVVGQLTPVFSSHTTFHHAGSSYWSLWSQRLAVVPQLISQTKAVQTRLTDGVQIGRTLGEPACAAPEVRGCRSMTVDAHTSPWGQDSVLRSG